MLLTLAEVYCQKESRYSYASSSGQFVQTNNESLKSQESITSKLTSMLNLLNIIYRTNQILSHCAILSHFLLKVVFHCSRFARAREATDFNLMKNQSRGHAKIVVKCSSTSKYVRAHKSRQKTLRLDTYSKS